MTYREADDAYMAMTRDERARVLNLYRTTVAAHADVHAAFIEAVQEIIDQLAGINQEEPAR